MNIYIAPLVNSVETLKEIYGLNSNEFHTIKLVCLSPNHWNDSVGNKHYFFYVRKL